MKKTPVVCVCVWFTCSGLLMKAVKRNWQEKCGYFLPLNFLLCQRKITVNVTLLCNVLPHKDVFFPRMPSMCENVFILLTCGWSRVSATWLHSSPDSHSDHPVVFFWPWLRSNQFYVVWGQQTALDLRAAGIVVVSSEGGSVRRWTFWII